MTLPVSTVQLAIARLLFLYMLWVLFVLLFWIASAGIRPYLISQIIWDMISSSGYMLIINAFPFVIRDLRFVFIGRFAPMLLGIAYLIFLGSLYLIFFLFTSFPYFLNFLQLPESTRNSFSAVSTTFPGALMFLIIGAVVSIYCVVIFCKRKTYLN